ncbi:MAG: NADPH-dependent F420 reductase [Ignavibacteriales bacterium]
MSKVAVLGGTGALGHALARRWAMAGRQVVIGSRDAARAVEAAAALSAETRATVVGMANREAAQACDIAVLTVPFASQAAVLEDVRPALAGKVLIDTTVPLVPPRVARVQLPAEGSAAVRAASLLGEDVRVVSAFHNVPAESLAADGPLDCDVLVFGDDKAARADALGLAQAAGLRAFHAGSLANSAAAEALTSVLIFLNKHYGGHGGIRLTGLGGGGDATP